MKRVAVAFVLLVVLLAGAAHAATVTPPKAGDSWLVGAQKTISWTGGGAGTGRLVLWRTSTGKVGVVKSGITVGAGSFTWTVGALEGGGSATAAKDYFVRLVKSDGTALGKSPVFAIATFDTSLASSLKSTVAGSLVAMQLPIAVSSPVNGSAFKPGSWIKLAWSTAGLQAYPNVRLGVYLPDRKTFVGSVGSSQNPADSWPNSGSYQAPVFNDRYQPGKQYVLRVATPDEKREGFSGVFTITSLTPTQVTEVFAAGTSLGYQKTDSAPWYAGGCLYTRGTAGPTPPFDTYPVGIYNILDDPTGPCWSVTSRLYRVLADFHGVYQGWEVTKAELRFMPEQGWKQTLSVSARESASADMGVPLTGVASLPGWGFGQQVTVDVTAVVKAWCTGQKKNHGFVISGYESGWGDKTDADRVTYISQPKLSVTRIEYQ